MSQIRLECEACGNHETISMEVKTELEAADIGRKLRKWLGVLSGDQPSIPNGPDAHRWYDSPTCMASGERQFEEKRLAQEEKLSENDKVRGILEGKMKKAQEQITKSAYCQPTA